MELELEEEDFCVGVRVKVLADSCKPMVFSV